MRILIAEDDPVSLKLLQVTLQQWGHEVVSCSDGAQALAAMEAPAAPRLAVLDWMMPELDGLEVCRRLKAGGGENPPYLILLTAMGRPEDVAEGLAAGADDYVVKPFDRRELQARIGAGARIVSLQESLSERVRDLEVALSQVKQLQGLLPICSYCKKIRDSESYWHQVEAYVAKHTDAEFSHGICPDCLEKHVQPEIEAVLAGCRSGRSTEGRG